MTAHAAPVTDERSALAAFIAQQQDALRTAVFGLTDAEAGTAASVSALAPGTLLKHLTGVQRNWLDLALAAPQPPVDDRPMPEKVAAHMSGFRWSENDTVADALAAYDEVSAAVLRAVETVDLDELVPVPDMPWFPKDVSHWTVRWVWFHVLEEVARHAGHADIVRESIDGAPAIDLLAAREGWPETDFVKPWKREPQALSSR